MSGPEWHMGESQAFREGPRFQLAQITAIDIYQDVYVL